jgi:hypothetical protein
MAKSLSSSKITPVTRSQAWATMGHAAYSQKSSSSKISSPSKALAGSVLAQSRKESK